LDFIPIFDKLRVLSQLRYLDVTKNPRVAADDVFQVGPSSGKERRGERGERGEKRREERRGERGERGEKRKERREEEREERRDEMKDETG
jgi:hypothetical protein